MCFNFFFLITLGSYFAKTRNKNHKIFFEVVLIMLVIFILSALLTMPLYDMLLYSSNIWFFILAPVCVTFFKLLCTL